MRFSLIAIAAACAAAPSAAVLAEAARAPLAASPENGFRRQAALPKWALPLGDIPATKRIDPVVIRLSETQAWVGAAPALLYNRAIQVNDSSSLGVIGQIGIDYFAAYQKLLLHRVVVIRDGRMIDHTATVNTRPLQRETAMESGMMGGATTLQLLLDDVRIGDTVWITYTIEGDNPVFGKLWSGDFNWDGGAPVELRLVTVLHPVARPLQWRQLGDFRTDKVEPVITRAGDIERLRFEGRAIDEIEGEPSVPSDYLAGRLLQFSEYRNWQDVANWADGLFPKNKASPALTALVRQFAAEPDPATRAAAALRWVQQEIRYFSVSIGENSHRPQVPDVVLKRRYGDCKDKSYLLISLLAEMGIEAHPVLLSATAPKLPAKILPSPLWFNHVVVQIKIDGRDYYVDPTSARQPEPLALIPGSLPGAAALLVERASTALITLPPRTDTLPHYELVQNIVVGDFEGAATMESRDIFRGTYADHARLRYPVMSVTEQKKAMLASYEKRYPGITLLEAPQLQDFPADNRYEIRTRYRMPKVVTLKGDTYGIDYDPKLINDTLGIPDNIVRNFPLELSGGRFRGRYRLNLSWPQQVRGAETPHANTVDNVFFRAHEEYTFRGNAVNYLMDYRIKKPVVAAADMATFHAEAKRLDAFSGGRFKAPAQLVIKPEQARLSARELDSARTGKFLATEMAQLAVKKDAEIESDEACRFMTLSAGLGAAASADVQKQAQRLEKAVSAKRSELDARACLAQLAFERGQFDQSVKLYRADATAFSNDSTSVRNLAWASLYAGDAGGALASMARYRAARAGTEAGFASNSDLADQIALLQRAGKPLPGDLQKLASEIPDGPWPRPLLAMQAGLITPAALVQAAEALPGDARAFALTEAWYYIGQAQLAKQDIAAAKAAFQWVASDGIRSADQYAQALAELQRLASPTAAVSADTGADPTDASAQFALAQRYAAGEGVLKDLSRAQALLEAAAAQGHARAGVMLGTMFNHGTGVAKNSKRAFDLFLAAAEAGDAEGARRLGQLYWDGDGVAKDMDQAIVWLQRAVERKDIVAMDELGRIYQNGWSVEADLPRAASLYRAAAEEGHADAQYHYGEMLSDGLGVRQEPAEAARWYKLAAAQGNLPATTAMGYRLMEGIGVPKNYPEALIYLRKAADKGSTPAMVNYGYCLAKGYGVPLDASEANAWYLKAAMQDDDQGQYNLATQYRYGSGVKQDLAAAVKWYAKAAANGNLDATWELAQMYLYGNGVERNYLTAVRWLSQASAKGNKKAQFALASMYANGKGVGRDGAKAFALIQPLAEQDDVQAMAELGTYYENGIGVARDDQLAAKWYRAAEAGGNAGAASLLYIMVEDGRLPGRASGDYKKQLDEAALGGDTAPLISLALAYASKYQRAQADATFERALRVREAHPGKDADLARILELLASGLQWQGKFAEALPLVQRLLALTEKREGAGHADVADVLDDVAAIERGLRHFAQADALLQRALAIREKHYGVQHMRVAETLLAISWNYMSMERVAESRQLQQRVMAMRAALTGVAQAEDVESLDIIATQYVNDGKYALAEPIARRILAMREATKGAGNPVIVGDIKFLANIAQKLKQYPQAERLFARALALKEAKRPSDPADVASALFALGQVYSDGMDQFDRAQPLLERALAMCEQERGPEAYCVAYTARELGRMFTGQKKYPQAEANFIRALTITERFDGPDDSNVALILDGYGLMLTRSGRYAEAETLLQRALTISERVYVAGHPRLLETQQNLAQLLRKSRGAKAADEFEKRAALKNPKQG